MLVVQENVWDGPLAGHFEEDILNGGTVLCVIIADILELSRKQKKKKGINRNTEPRDE